MQKREKENSLIEENITLERQIKEFQNIVYKHGESVTTIQKFTLKPRPDKGFSIGDYRSTFLHTTFKTIPKLYSMDQLIDNNVVRVVVYNTEEEQELEEQSRSKMSQA